MSEERDAPSPVLGAVATGAAHGVLLAFAFVVIWAVHSFRGDGREVVAWILAGVLGGSVSAVASYVERRGSPSDSARRHALRALGALGAGVIAAPIILLQVIQFYLLLVSGSFAATVDELGRVAKNLADDWDILLLGGSTLSLPLACRTYARLRRWSLRWVVALATGPSFFWNVLLAFEVVTIFPGPDRVALQILLEMTVAVAVTTVPAAWIADRLLARWGRDELS